MNAEGIGPRKSPRGGLLGPLLALILAPAASAEVAIRWDLDAGGRAMSVSVVGLPNEALARLKREEMPNIFPVHAGGSATAGLPGMLGSYRVEGNTLRFVPRFPLVRGQAYRAVFRSGAALGTGPAELVATHVEPKLVHAAARVTRVEPTGDHLPENLLKFYLHFSAPMARGEVYERARIVRSDGSVVDGAFLRLGEELWDPSGTRLTLLIDPGRIKQGLKPRELFGPVLEAGKAYALEVDAAWPDAEGQPLGQGFRKSFRAGPADETQPDPRKWVLSVPRAGSRLPLVARSPEPLDAALFDSAVTLVNGRGEAVEGAVTIDQGETGWSFVPEVAWVAGAYQLIVDGDLEDRAGNSVARPFEVDIQRSTPIKPLSEAIRLPIQIEPAKP